ncbi:hypothetical protein RFI_14154 [Reticulomyxa filosa]|uniref:Uncharacterized protein n=1 Tax=Reticulomyxa filosa TaxID=46433 RepID=X6NB89_RETFI|nr:hypothetical protein RFI_14154 [Reticulomyxa filosa]|eukprot:ETO23029.1 hypothetical protein RFI_14154 [Reticulomyxa filosa]
MKNRPEVGKTKKKREQTKLGHVIEAKHIYGFSKLPKSKQDVVIAALQMGKTIFFFSLMIHNSDAERGIQKLAEGKVDDMNKTKVIDEELTRSEQYLYFFWQNKGKRSPDSSKWDQIKQEKITLTPNWGECLHGVLLQSKDDGKIIDIRLYDCTVIWTEGLAGQKVNWNKVNLFTLFRFVLVLFLLSQGKFIILQKCWMNPTIAKEFINQFESLWKGKHFIVLKKLTWDFL